MEKMDNTVEEIVSMMETIVDEAKFFPMSHGKVMIEKDQFLDMLADLREALPRELEDARRIVADRSNILENAKKDAEMTTRAAEDRAKRLIDHDEIVKQAQMKALLLGLQRYCSVRLSSACRISEEYPGSAAWL